MHIYFLGIGGVGIGSLATIAQEAGFKVSGSDKQNNNHIEDLRLSGIENISITQTSDSIEDIHQKNPIDWLVYSSAVIKENKHHPELEFARQHSIKTSKRDEFINYLLRETGQKMIAIAGTHGKSTTTAMIIWLFKQLKIPLSYSVGAEISFGKTGQFNKLAKYFVYEADEYDRNFLNFNPEISAITGLGYDHPDIYPNEKIYNQAFIDFIKQSKATVIWSSDIAKLTLPDNLNIHIIDSNNTSDAITLEGIVNRIDGLTAVKTLEIMQISNNKTLLQMINKFPGVYRRFEKISNNIYSDYAHTPEKIRGALQMANEVSTDKVVVVYEGLHNTRQHFIKKELENLFEGAESVYIVPSYLAREDKNLEMLTPEKLSKLIKKPTDSKPVKIDKNLKEVITRHAKQGDLVLCLSAGGGGSLDEWLRLEFKT